MQKNIDKRFQSSLTNIKKDTIYNVYDERFISSDTRKNYTGIGSPILKQQVLFNNIRSNPQKGFLSAESSKNNSLVDNEVGVTEKNNGVRTTKFSYLNNYKKGQTYGSHSRAHQAYNNNAQEYTGYNTKNESYHKKNKTPHNNNEIQTVLLSMRNSVSHEFKYKRNSIESSNSAQVNFDRRKHTGGDEKNMYQRKLSPRNNNSPNNTNYKKNEQNSFELDLKSFQEELYKNAQNVTKNQEFIEQVLTNPKSQQLNSNNFEFINFDVKGFRKTSDDSIMDNKTSQRNHDINKNMNLTNSAEKRRGLSLNDVKKSQISGHNSNYINDYKKKGKKITITSNQRNTTKFQDNTKNLMSIPENKKVNNKKKEKIDALKNYMDKNAQISDMIFKAEISNDENNTDFDPKMPFMNSDSQMEIFIETQGGNDEDYTEKLTIRKSQNDGSLILVANQNFPQNHEKNTEKDINLTIVDYNTKKKEEFFELKKNTDSKSPQNLSFNI